MNNNKIMDDNKETDLQVSELQTTESKIDTQIELNIPDENNTDFPLSLLNQFKRIKYDDSEFLRYSQYIVREYIINSHGRGLLCYWGMGFGKTPLAVSITEYYRTQDPSRNIIFLSAKSLANNFRKSLADYMQNVEKVSSFDIERIIEEKYRFVSSNASNMFKQIQNINKTEEDLIYEKKLGDLTNAFTKERSLENSLVIVDEAHNLFNSVSNGSKNALGFYDLVMRTKNIKLIFLTGTPAVNDPFELVSCFNMLKGRLYENNRRRNASLDTRNKKSRTDVAEPTEPTNLDDVADPDTAEPDNAEPTEDGEAEGGLIVNGGGYDSDAYHSDNDDDVVYGGGGDFTLFPENRDDFENWFVDFDNLGIKNKDIFQARLSGLISYYGPVYFDKGDGQPREFFPKELPAIVKKIPMSGDQYAAYASARDKERAEAARPKFKAQSERFSSGQKASSTYRVESRQISNFRFPPHALGPIVGLKLPEKLLSKLTDHDLDDTGLASNSPKMLSAYNDIIEFFNAGKRLGIFYSSFVVSGLKVFSKILEHRGWKSYNSLPDANTQLDQLEQKMSDEILGGVGGGGISRKLYSRKIKKGGEVEKKQYYKYAIISGEVPPEDRAEIVRIFNSPENSHGGVIDLLLISSTGVEGLDLKGLRFGIMLEPYWHDARRGQFAARMVRYKSHEHLPLEERDCQLVIYLSDYPIKIATAAIKEEKTTDNDLYDESLAGKVILDKFFLATIESSIDCNIHHTGLDPEVKKKISCLLCKPTGQQLYNTNIRHDFEQERPCQRYSVDSDTKSITAKEVIIDGKKFFYTYDGSKGLDSLNIYEYNKNLDGHIPIRANNPYYPAIMEKLLELLV